MILLIDTLTIVLAAVAVHLNFKVKEDSLDHKIFGLTSGLLLIHALAQLPFDRVFVNWSVPEELNAPFTLMYGPIVIQYAKMGKKGNYSPLSVLCHLLPVLFFWSLYIVQVADLDFFQLIGSIYDKALLLSNGISFLSYSIYIEWTNYKNKNYSSDAKIFTRFLLCGGILIGLTAIRFFLMESSRDFGIDFPQLNDSIQSSSFLCLGAFFLADVAFKNFTKFYKNFSAVKSKEVEMEQTSELMYESSEQVDDDFKDLEQFFSSSIIENRNLTVKMAAKSLGWTQKRLLDNISRHYDTSFSRILSTKRVIQVASRIVSPNFDGRFENLVESSGFGSSATFYRQFKIVFGCTPTEYLIRFNENNNNINL